MATPAERRLMAQDKTGSKDPVIGDGDHNYECIHDWGGLPSSIKYGNTHSVCENGQGHIYVHQTVHKDSLSPIASWCSIKKESSFDLGSDVSRRRVTHREWACTRCLAGWSVRGMERLEMVVDVRRRPVIRAEPKLTSGATS